MQLTLEPAPTQPPLWKHQQYALEHYWDKKAWAHLWEPRCGKTRATIEQIKRWLTDKKVRKVLVVASKTICENVWEPEIANAFPENTGNLNVKIIPLYSGSVKYRARSVSFLHRLTDKPVSGIESNFQVVVVINQEALRYMKSELIAWAPEAIIMDEAHRFKTPSSERHKVMYALSKSAKFIRALTGTPTPQGYVDIYGLYKILDPSIFGTRMSDFTAQFCVMDTRIPGRILQYRNVDTLQQKMFQIADVVKKSDCFDMPIRQDIVRKIVLSPAVKKAYDKVAKEHVIEHASGNVSLDHTLSRLSYLQQFAGGYVPERAGIPGYWLHDEKLNACVEEVRDILESNQKVIIFHKFKIEGEKLAQTLGYSQCAQISADVKGLERKRLIDSFNGGEWPRVLILQEEIGAEGISLVGANYSIFYSCGLSWATHEQARERPFKPGAEHKLTYIYLQCKGTADTWAQGIIRKQKNVADELLQYDFRKIAMGEN